MKKCNKQTFQKKNSGFKPKQLAEFIYLTNLCDGQPIWGDLTCVSAIKTPKKVIKCSGHKSKSAGTHTEWIN